MEENLRNQSKIVQKSIGRKVVKDVLLVGIIMLMCVVMCACTNDTQTTEDAKNGEGTSTPTIKDSSGKSIVLTSENAADYYGKEVDYKANSSDTATWRIFYVDHEGKYGDKGTIYLKADAQEGVTSLLSYESYDSSDTTIMEKMNQDWATEEKSENGGKVKIDNANEHVVSWLCDPTQWKKYANSDANYAIGAPSIEMYIDSYNEAFGENYKYKRANSYGYQFSTDGGASWKNYTETNTISADKNKLYVSGQNGLWLASPSAVDDGDVCLVYCKYSSVGSAMYGLYVGGESPVVSLKSGVIPKLK